MIRTASTFDMSEECANQIDKDYMLDKLYQSSDSGVESVNLFELSSPIWADAGAFLFLFLIFLVTSFSLSLSQHECLQMSAATFGISCRLGKAKVPIWISDLSGCV